MLSGLLLVLLGLWGGLIPFVGPYFGVAYSPDAVWVYTPGRLLTEILPAAGAIFGGLIMLVTASRPMAYLGGLLAAASGAWYIFGGFVAQVWTFSPASWTGVPVGGPLRQAAERIGFFYGPGAGIIFFAALALGRFAVVGVREARDKANGPPPYILDLPGPPAAQASPPSEPAKKQRATA
jgi:hypothetical protein